MKVVLAEKPSVARDIANVLGASRKRDGYYEGNDYAVTYAFGHLVTIAEPEEMNPDWGKPWRLEQLPMLPENWKYNVTAKSGAQFSVIKKLFLAPETTSIICATDAGREGEHIFRLIYKLSGCKKPVERLWISSLTEEAIREGIAKLKPASEFDNLADAASGRAHADWIVGLNFTRAYTCINRNLCTIGRVQTPTLALITERQAQIDAFSSSKFYEVQVSFAPGFLSRYINNTEEAQTRITDKAFAEQILSEISKEKEGSVQSINTVEKRNRAPALYDLLTLQKDANKRFSYTAQETLDIAQSLYEEYKLISYPRTESRHISTDMVSELPRILSNLLKTQSADVLAAFAKESIVPGKITASLLRPKLGKTYVDDTKLTDHHAIIPTFNNKPANLPERQSNVYNLIAARFLSIFLAPELRDETTAIIKLAEHLFRARGVVIKDPGWTVIDPGAVDEPDKEKEKGKGKGKSRAKDKEKEQAEDVQKLPALLQGQALAKLSEELKEGKTSPPKPYDDSSLLTAMKNAGQELDDEDLSAYMKQKGLGTPATRAAIIERLLQTGYIERQKKYLLPTEKGKALIQQVHADLKNVALTATWEQKLSDMQDGNLNLPSFENQIADFVSKILPAISSQKGLLVKGPKSDPKSIPDGIASCPQCNSGIVRPTPKGAGCNRWREGCKFSIWAEVFGKKLSDAQMKELIEKGRTKVIKGFKKKDGSGTYDARLILNEEFKVRMEFDEKTLGKCPLCKEGDIRMSSKGAGCKRWREGCKFFIWSEQFGKELSEDQIKELIEKKETGIISGFKKKSGEGTYDARLVLSDEFKIRLSFENNAEKEPVPSSVGKNINEAAPGA